jgi:hypothetical protein
MSEGFTVDEATAKMGRCVMTCAEFSGVPILTAGTVVEIYRRDVGYGISVRWDLPSGCVDGFSKSEYESYLIES